MKHYAVHYSRPAAKELDALPTNVQTAVVEVVGTLGENPRPVGAKKLVGSDNKYRIRVGRYRIIYEVHDKTVTVLIVRIAHRKDAYR
jgi:mRNA interferase RelE/StbE